MAPGMSAAATAAVVLAAAAGALLPAAGGGQGLRRLARPDRGPGRPGGGTGRERTGSAVVAGPGGAGWLVGLLVAGAVIVVSRLVIAALLAGGLVAAVLVGWQRRQGRRRALACRANVVELCQAMAAELRAGADARAALLAAVAGLPASRTDPMFARLAAVAAAPYGEVAPELAALSLSQGAGGLADLAACWRVSERYGSGLEPALVRLARALRADEQVRRELTAQLAGPRATAALLALLPVVGVAMGWAVGADPLRVLLRTGPGQAGLLVGAALDVAGLLWTSRIARAVEPR